MRLHIFNPETDYALATGAEIYTPPSSVVKMRQEFALLPAIYANYGDVVLLPEGINPENSVSLKYHDKALEKNIKIVTASELPELWDSISEILPWGWNHALRYQLLDAGASESKVISLQSMDKLRELSHRRTCLTFRKMIAEIHNFSDYDHGKELHSVEEVAEFLLSNPHSYFKKPWSSSGRGVVCSNHISERGLLEWCAGSIRRQGSVMAEPGWTRKMDFATEWFCNKGEARFAGVSVFETSDRGKYHGNLIDSQIGLWRKIKSAVPLFNRKVIEAQKKVLESLITPYYDGPVGIDMLADTAGRINPCVEINLRMTMGHVALMNR